MIEKSRIGFFTPSIGIADEDLCLEFVKSRGGLIQGWTVPPAFAHEMKPGISGPKIIEEAESGRIRVSSLSGYMDWTEKENIGPRRHAFTCIIEECARCGCDIVCTETGRCHESTDDREAWDVLADNMKFLCSGAERKGVFVAVEMGRRDLVFGAESFLKLKELVGSAALKVNFDPANLVRGGLDPLESAIKLKDEIVQVHLKDADEAGMRPLTEGSVDFAALAGIMESSSYSGNYIIAEGVFSASVRRKIFAMTWFF